MTVLEAALIALSLFTLTSIFLILIETDPYTRKYNRLKHVTVRPVKARRKR